MSRIHMAMTVSRLGMYENRTRNGEGSWVQVNSDDYWPFVAVLSDCCQLMMQGGWTGSCRSVVLE